ncbi:hypothetical protein GCM10022223_18260 [Kineosporia mesophila]|uniref:ABM domain-containing protein n=2 Tax=Kineosporia mesophila TaxID=566012 RepID=A0ABP6ZA32_9ACTN
MIVRPDSGVITVIERFATHTESGLPTDGKFQVTNTPPDPTASAVPSAATRAARDHLEKSLRHTEGFVSATLLQGQGGEIALYSQWNTTDPAVTQVRPEWSLRTAFTDANDIQLVDARTFSVDFVAPGQQTLFSRTATPHAHFGVFTMPPHAQDELLEAARVSAPRSIGTPGLEAINFHRSLDGSEVINFGAWTTFAHFRELFQRPGFSADEKWYQGLASFRNYFFAVLAVIDQP